MVGAWANSNQLGLGQIKTDEKTNKAVSKRAKNTRLARITAITKLLDLLDISGYIITIDAMGCQRNIAKKITNAKS